MLSENLEPMLFSRHKYFVKYSHLNNSLWRHVYTPAHVSNVYFEIIYTEGGQLQNLEMDMSET